MGLPHEGLSTAFCCTVHEGRQCVGRGVLQSAVPEKTVNLPQIEKGPGLRHPSYAGVTQTVRRDLIQQPRASSRASCEIGTCVCLFPPGNPAQRRSTNPFSRSTADQGSRRRAPDRPTERKHEVLEGPEVRRFARVDEHPGLFFRKPHGAARTRPVYSASTIP